MVKFLEYNRIKHVLKTYYNDKFKKDKYSSQKFLIKNQFSKELSNLFEELLSRKIDKKGMKRFISLLMKNETTLNEIKNEIINSKEYSIKQEIDAENAVKHMMQESEKIVSDIFIEIMKRKADKPGLKKYTILLATGKMTQEEIKNEMMNAEEYFWRIKTDAKNISKPIMQESEKIVSDIFIEIMKRKADKPGLKKYAALLASGNMTQEEIKNEMLTCQEYFRLIELDAENMLKIDKKKYEKIVSDIYHEFLFRKPDNDGLTKYVLSLATGKMTEKEIRYELSHSTESIDVFKNLQRERQKF